MAIPLPRVVADVGPGGPLVTALEGVNALRKSNAEAQYAPYLAAAEAASKSAYAKYLPYQLQAQVIANPLIAMALSQSKDKNGVSDYTNMLNNFKNSIPMNGGDMGGMGIPAPNQLGNGLVSLFLNKIAGQKQPQPGQQSNQINNVPEQESQNNLLPPNPLLPSAQGNIAGVVGKMGAQYIESPYGGGSLIPDPRNPGYAISVPTGSNVDELQKRVIASKRVIPVIESISDNMAPFLTLSGESKEKLTRVANYFGVDAKKLKEKGLDAFSPSQLAFAKQNIEIAPADMLKAFGLTDTVDAMKRLQTAVEPVKGETPEGYKWRLYKTINQIANDQMGTNLQVLGQGISTKPPGTRSTSSAENKDEGPSLSQETVKILQQTAAANKMDVPSVINELSKTQAGQKWLNENGIQ